MTSRRLLGMLVFFCSFSLSAQQSPTISFKSLPAESLGKSQIKDFKDLNGKVVLVDFWAAWCEPCKQALPHYNKLFKKYQDQGLMVIGINEDDDIKERDAFLKTKAPDFPLFADTNKEMLKTFNVQAIPSLFVFDKKMNLVSTHRGFSEEKFKNLELKIQDLLK